MKLSNNIFWMGMVSFFTDFASSLVMPILPLFVVLILDQGIDKLGLILAITTLVSYLLRFIGGALSDKYQNNKALLILGYSLSALAKPCFAVIDSWQGIAAVRSTERLGKALRAAPKDKLISLSAEKTYIGRGIATHKAIEKSGELLGLLSLLLIVLLLGSSEQTMRAIFTVSIIPGLLSVIVLLFFVQESSGGRPKSNALFNFKLEKSVRAPILAYTLLSIFMFNEAFFILIGKQMGLSLVQVLLIYILSRLLQIWLSLRMRKVLDGYSSHKLLGIGYLAGIISLLLLLMDNISSYAIAFILLGLYDVITLNTLRSYIGKNAHDKGATFGLLYFVVAISASAGVYLLSLIWQYTSLNMSICVASLGVLSTGFIIYRYQRLLWIN